MLLALAHDAKQYLERLDRMTRAHAERLYVISLDGNELRLLGYRLGSKLSTCGYKLKIGQGLLSF